MHDLQLAEDLLAHGRFRVDEDDLPNITSERVPCYSETTTATVPSSP
jgi:hypothetical protein